MAIGTTFKQQCPSCEAMVPVRDEKLIGKKIECPKCKDKFVVKSPAAAKPDDDDDDDDTVKVDPKGKAKTKPTKKPAKDEDDGDEPKKGKKKPKVDDEARKKKFRMGVMLAVVGLLVLAAAAYFILRPKSPTNLPGNKNKFPVQPIPPENTDKKDDKGITPMPEVPKTHVTLAGPTVELTNLLPNGTDYVAHIPFKWLFEPASAVRDALFNTPGALKDDFLKSKLGFSVLAVDDVLRADKYEKGGKVEWSFTVVHLQEPIDQAAVKTALALKPAPAIRKHEHYVAGANPWFECLARVTVGVPRDLRSTRQRPLHVHFHNAQTLVFADAAIMAEFLGADKNFKTMSDVPAPPPPVNDPNQPPAAEQAKPMPKGDAPKIEQPKTEQPKTEQPKDKQTEAKDKEPEPASGPTYIRTQPYMTIKPALKAVLDRMELLNPDLKDKLLFASAVDLEAAQVTSPPPGYKGKLVFHPGLAWDLTLLLQDRKPRLRILGTSLLQRDGLVYRVRNDLECPVDTAAKSLQKELAEQVSHEIAGFFERWLAHKVELPKKDDPTMVPVPMPPPNPNDPPKEMKEELPAASKITVNQKDKTVEFLLDLKLDQGTLGKLHTVAGLMACSLSQELYAAAGVLNKHDLAQAAKVLPQKGLSDRGVAPGNYPPGAFKRTGFDVSPLARQPGQRVSWMAGLLPFLGHDSLYQRIHFDASWRDPVNWLAGNTAVSQFLDPTYPVSTHFVKRHDLPFELATTHFVGIAGVGLDAADYDHADPANVAKRGVLSYDKGMSLEEIQKGHGLSNTILMLQVPPDKVPGPQPWIAGGGPTLRGVPDKNSIAPFVFQTTGADGKPRRGTHAVMTDGSVRFIDASISDNVLKALATATTPLPEGYDLNAADSKTPLLKGPASAPPLKK